MAVNEHVARLPPSFWTVVSPYWSMCSLCRARDASCRLHCLCATAQLHALIQNENRVLQILDTIKNDTTTAFMYTLAKQCIL